MPNNRTLTVLRTWGRLGRQLARAHFSVISWDPARRLIAAAAPRFKALANELSDLLRKSDNLVKPLSDPLRTNFGGHRWLSSEREEAYSDWLAWIVQQMDSPGVLRVFRVKELFSDKPVGKLDGRVRPEVKREVCVPQGHTDREGRLDLVIRFADRIVVIVETKLGHADSADTKKQEGYAEWCKRQRGTPYSILLASEGDKPAYPGGFRLLRWVDLCLELRHLVIELCARKQIVLAAMTLAFVGAVERNLLGFSIGAIDDFQHGRSATFDPAVVVHLQRSIDEVSK